MEDSWIHVADTLPDAPGRYLVCCAHNFKGNPFVGSAWFYPDTAEDRCWLFDRASYAHEREITHWLPMPAILPREGPR